MDNKQTRRPRVAQARRNHGRCERRTVTGLPATVAVRSVGPGQGPRARGLFRQGRYSTRSVDGAAPRRFVPARHRRRAITPGRDVVERGLVVAVEERLQLRVADRARQRGQDRRDVAGRQRCRGRGASNDLPVAVCDNRVARLGIGVGAAVGAAAMITGDDALLVGRLRLVWIEAAPTSFGGGEAVAPRRLRAQSSRWR